VRAYNSAGEGPYSNGDSGYRQLQPPSDHLVARWSFDNSANPGFDDSGNGASLENHGATWTSNGHLGGAMSFDGINDRMETTTSFTVNTNDLRTVSAWVYLRSTGVGRGIVMLPGYTYPSGDVAPLSSSLINHSSSFQQLVFSHSITARQCC